MTLCLPCEVVSEIFRHVHCHRSPLKCPKPKFWTPWSQVTLASELVEMVQDGHTCQTVRCAALPPSNAEIAAVDKWDKDKLSAKSLLTQKIPDSTLMCVHNKRTVKPDG